MNGTKKHSRLAKVLGSRHVEDIFSSEEIRSLENNLEHMGIACIDENGIVKRNAILESTSTSDGSVSNVPVDEMKDICDKGEIPAWWHTHDSTLSTLSVDDRLSSGRLKLINNVDVTCAIGIEGYSCHFLDSSPPATFQKRWGDGFFSKLKASKAIDVIFDSSKSWYMEKGNESDVDQLSCSVIEPDIVGCVGIDWNTGINRFPVGVYNQVVFSGNVDIMPSNDGFDALISPGDKKLECVSILMAGKKKVLYCR